MPRLFKNTVVNKINKLALLVCNFFIIFLPTASAQDLNSVLYDIGSPNVQTVWVDPSNGSNSNSGSSRGEAFRTVAEAWSRIPQNTPLTQGYQINLVAGSYPVDGLPNYWENRRGTYNNPIIFKAIDGDGTAVFRSGPNIFNTSYIYFLGVNFIPNPAGDAFHCEKCDHVLLKNLEASGGARQAHETIKVNQSRYFYIEGCNVHGADDNSIDFVSVQYGHIKNSKIHDAQDWCAYAKGGSAYIVFEANEVYNCGTGGITAGQGTGLEFKDSPWIHYEAYDIKIVNNIIHDTEGAGLGVNGGYNILLAYNTLYRVGQRSHTLEVVYGLISCDGNVSACQQRIDLGGWGTTQVAGEGEPVPNKNVYIYNNVIYNPASHVGASQIFAIYGPRNPSPSSSFPPTVTTDDNLVIKGNVIWNLPGTTSIGIEGGAQGCTPSNPTCNLTQIQNDNQINVIEPQLISPSTGDYRPTQTSNLLTATAFTVPNFNGGDRPTTPQPAEGVLVNQVPRDFGGSNREQLLPQGAYYSYSSNLAPDNTNNTPTGNGNDLPPTIQNFKCTKKVKVNKKYTCSANISDDRQINSANLIIKNKTYRLTRASGSLYKKSIVAKKVGKLSAMITVVDSGSQTVSSDVKNIKVTR